MVRLRTIHDGEELQALAGELAHARSPEPQLSMYVDMDVRAHPTVLARRTAFGAAVDEARRTAPDASWRRVLEELRDDQRRNRHDLDDARGVLVYARRGEEPTLVKLPRPVEPHVAWDHAVHVRPLLRGLATVRYCVLLCNRRTARMLLGDRDGLQHVARLHDDIDVELDGGMWSEPRQTRRIDTRVDEHLRHTSRMLLELQEAGGFDRLLIAAPTELRPRLLEALHDYTRRVHDGWLDIDVDHASVHDIAEQATVAIARQETRRERELVEHVQELAGRGERVALGVREVLAALCERRVDTLLLVEGLARPGLACPHGDWLATTSGSCPVHDVPLEPVGDVVELALELALLHGSHVVTIGRDDPLARRMDLHTTSDSLAFQQLRTLGSIAGILRYEVVGTGIGAR